MNKYEELLNAIRTNYGTHSEYYKTVKELVDQTKTPNLEEVLKECEDDGWKWYFSKQKESVLFLTNSIKHISIIIDIEEKNYHKTCSWDYSEYLPLSYQEHNLVSKIFRALD